jgi:acyl-CoA synthetase (AMP-forming)/AMP-acid ligase II
VLDAIVIGTPNERWGQQVTAIVRRRDGRDVSEDELRIHARTVIADYKVPKAVLFVDTMPRTPVGKVDYKGATDLAISLLAG